MRSGRGHFVYDMAVTLLMLWPFDPGQSQRAAFLQGYRAVRPFPLAHEKLLNLFIAARGVGISRWILGNDANRSESGKRWVAGTVKRLGTWLSR